MVFKRSQGTELMKSTVISRNTERVSGYFNVSYYPFEIPLHQSCSVFPEDFLWRAILLFEIILFPDIMLVAVFSSNKNLHNFWKNAKKSHDGCPYEFARIAIISNVKLHFYESDPCQHISALGKLTIGCIRRITDQGLRQEALPKVIKTKSSIAVITTEKYPPILRATSYSIPLNIFLS
jgi:hypothetical protein